MVPSAAPPPLPPRSSNTPVPQAQAATLLACFKPSQSSIDSLWKSDLTKVTKTIYSCFHNAIEGFLQPTSRHDISSETDEERLQELKRQAVEILQGSDAAMRFRLLDRALNDAGSWLEDRRREPGWQPEVEDAEVGQQIFYTLTQCIIKTDPWTPFSRQGTKRCLFMFAAENGLNRVLKDIIRELEEHLATKYHGSGVPGQKEMQEELLKALNTADGSGNTALSFAALGGQLASINVLLEYRPELADGAALMSLLEDDNDSAFARVIKYRPQSACAKTLRDAIFYGHAQAVKSFRIAALLLCTNPTLIDDDDTGDTSRLIIETEDPLLWEKVKQYCDICFLKESCSMLHDAVYNQRADIVKYIVEKCPALCLAERRNYYSDRPLHETREVHYALWYNCNEHSKQHPRIAEIEKSYNDRSEASYSDEDRQELSRLRRSVVDAQQGIRDLIVPAIIRAAEPFKIRQIFKKSNVTANNICLPLSSFNTSAHDFMLYVKGLVENSERRTTDNSIQNGSNLTLANGADHMHQAFKPNHAKAIKFETVLRYADFPDLNSTFPCTFDDYRRDYEEAKHVLKWLSWNRVSEIVEVRVADRLHTPHDDEVVRFCVQNFRVQTLNWRKLDLCLADIDPACTLKTLHLYSSGNMAVVHNWLSRTDTGGLIHLKNLETLYVYVVEDVLSNEKAERVKTCLIKEFAELKVVCGWKEDPKVETQRWYKHKVEDFGKDLKEIVKQSFPEISTFVGKYKVEKSKAETPFTSTKSKVCLIDSGVIIVENNSLQGNNQLHIGAQIEDGQSFVYNDGFESPWWHASIPHGTQMASILCSIDPSCELYVTKVGDAVGHYSTPGSAPVSPERVSEAVEWAISKQVDIIVLCLVVARETKELKSAFKEAESKNIVVICSTTDVGRNWKETWPAQYARHPAKSGGECDNIIGIGACDKEGYRLEYTQDTGYPFQFKGKDIYVGPIPFVESEDYISGSSVATAIAAGIASLTLSCCRLANNEAAISGHLRYETIIKKFKSMSETLRENDDPRYAALQNFTSKPFKSSTNWEKTLKREFGVGCLERWILPKSKRSFDFIAA